MSAPPWMPLYVPLYLADTGHLSTTEHGAYLLLIMHYWQHDGIPSDDESLSSICRLSTENWSEIRRKILAFFQKKHGRFRHKRIDREIAKTKKVSKVRSLAGKAGASVRHGKSQTFAKRLPKQNDGDLTLNTSVPEGTASIDPETDLFRRGKEVLGTNAGGVIAKLLKFQNGKIGAARAVIEQASEKQNPREYVGAVLKKKVDEGNVSFLDIPIDKALG